MPLRSADVTLLHRAVAMLRRLADATLLLRAAVVVTSVIVITMHAAIAALQFVRQYVHLFALQFVHLFVHQLASQAADAVALTAAAVVIVIITACSMAVVIMPRALAVHQLAILAVRLLPAAVAACKRPVGGPLRDNRWGRLTTRLKKANGGLSCERPPFRIWHFAGQESPLARRYATDLPKQRLRPALPKPAGDGFAGWHRTVGSRGGHRRRSETSGWH